MTITAEKRQKKYRFKFTALQVENLKALINDATIKGEAAPAIVELIKILDNPLRQVRKHDIRGEHNDTKKHSKKQPKKN